MRVLSAVFLIAVAASAPLQAQERNIKLNEADWPTRNRDLAGTRFSPLNQINTENVTKLTQAWSYRLRGDAPGAPAAFGGVVPIVVDGVMYLAAGNRVVALSPETGKEVWQYQLEKGGVQRGVSYWPGDANHPARIFFNTVVGRNTQIVALNAKTGKIDPGFGNEGKIEVPSVRYGPPPTIFKNILLIGTTTAEVPVGEPGDTNAFDARTGKKLWEFHTVPRPGEIGHETWQNDSWKGRSGVNVWGFYMTADEERGLIYMPVSGPAANYYGGDRPGDNLFSDSVVAVDAETGKYKWHFQTVHHDLWDQDQPAAPGLFDVVQNGVKIPALALIGKTGWMYILDRVTGKPIFGVEERPVPKGDVPGEWYSPTQPFPLKPPPLARMAFAREDLVTEADTSAAHAKACRDLLEKHGGFYNAGPFTPFLLHEDGKPPRSTINFPGNGGANWGGTASDPNLGYVFVNTQDAASTGWMEIKKQGQNYGRGTEASKQPYDRASVNGPGAYSSFTASFTDEQGRRINLPCQKPPYGRLFAINANTGDIAWEVPLGVTDELPEGKQNTGRTNLGGPIATAGGLVFIGATPDRRFRAFDSKTGKELWASKLEYNAQTVPITFRGKNGKQYVAVITAGGGGYGGPGEEGASRRNNEALVAFALPD
jgi:quinoprotein glucose dehydrogenase